MCVYVCMYVCMYVYVCVYAMYVWTYACMDIVLIHVCAISKFYRVVKLQRFHCMNYCNVAFCSNWK